MLLVDDLAAGGTKNLRHTPRGLVTLSKNVFILPEFTTSTHVFREVFGTSAKALKTMSSLEVVASSSLMLCRSRTQKIKRKSDLY